MGIMYSRSVRTPMMIFLAGILTMPSTSLSSSSPSTALARDNNAFALDFFSQVRTEEGHLFFSPYSISAALAMTYAGARSRTAEQMARTLHFELAGESLHAAFAELDESLRAAGKTAGVEIVTANSLWPHERFSFLEEFFALIQRHYAAAITPLDYSAPEEARSIINGWVADKTRDKIKDLIPPRLLDDLTVLVLTNAIYFKGDWAIRFDKQSTHESLFHKGSGETARVEMMTQTSKLGYASDEDIQILELPYMGGDLSMLVLLPREHFGLANLESSLTSGRLEAWAQQLHETAVQVFLPRFKLRWKSRLQDPLRDLGMTDAFGGDADFSGMNGEGGILISEVIHEAFVDVNEEGTEASAATAVVVTRSSPLEITTFRADHPFLFLIRDARSGSILFLGRVVDPSG